MIQLSMTNGKLLLILFVEPVHIESKLETFRYSTCGSVIEFAFFLLHSGEFQTEMFKRRKNSEHGRMRSKKKLLWLLNFFPYCWKLRFRTKIFCQNAALWYIFNQKDTQDAKKKKKKKKRNFCVEHRTPIHSA